MAPNATPRRWPPSSNIPFLGFVVVLSITMAAASSADEKDISSSSIDWNHNDALPTAFYCPSEGLFADDYDCQIYYRCESKTNDYIKPYMFACKGGSVFSRDLKLCMPPTLAGRDECLHYVNEIDMGAAKPKPDSSDINIDSSIIDALVYNSEDDGDGSDDRRLISGGIAKNGNAMKNYGLNGLSGVSIISFSTSSPRSANGYDEDDGSPACQDDGFMSNPNDCTIFYRCISNGNNFNKIGFRCPDGTAWDEALQSCNYISNVRTNSRCYTRDNSFNEQSATQSSQSSSFQNSTSSSSSNSQQHSSSSSSTSSSSNSSSTSSSSSNSSSNSTSSASSSTTQSSQSQSSSHQQSSSTENTSASSSNNQENASSSSSNNQASISNQSQNSNSNQQSSSSSSQNSQGSTNNSNTNNSNSSQSHATECESEETYIADPEDCANFYRCKDNGSGKLEKVPFTCGPGTVWNQDEKACDLPTEAQKENCRIQGSLSSGNQQQGQQGSGSQQSSQSSNQGSSSINQGSNQSSSNNQGSSQSSSNNQGSNQSSSNNQGSNQSSSSNQGSNQSSSSNQGSNQSSSISQGSNQSSSSNQGSNQSSSSNEGSNQSSSSNQDSNQSSSSNQGSNQSSSSNQSSNNQESNQSNSSNQGSSQSSSNNQGSNQSTTSNESSNQSGSNHSQQSSSNNSTQQPTNQKPVNPDGTCKDNETYLPDKTDCKRFYRCIHNGNAGFDVVPFDCPPNTVWDPDSKGCNHPTDVQKEQCKAMASGSWSSNNQNNQGSSSSTSSGSQGGSSSNQSGSNQSSSSSSNQNQGSSSNHSGSNQSSSSSSNQNQSNSSNQSGSNQSSSGSSNQNQGSSSNQSGSNQSSSNSSNQNQGSSSNQSGSNHTSSGSSNQNQGSSSNQSGSSSSSSSNTSTTGGTDIQSSTTQKPFKPADHCIDETTFLQDKQNCSRFYRCVNDGKGGFMQVSFDCPANTVWDPQANSCNYPFAVQNLDCKMNTPTTTTGSTSSGSGSQSSGMSSSSSQGSSSSQSGQSSQSSGSSSTSQQGSSNQESNTSQSGQSSQSSSSGSSSQQSSQQSSSNSGSQQSSTSNNQSSSSNSSASSSSQQTSSSSSGNQMQGGSQTSMPDGECNNLTQFLGDRNNCAIFYRCVDNGKGGYDKVPFTCGPGTVWDSRIEACNHAWAVKDKDCGTFQQSQPTTQSPPTSASLTTSRPIGPPPTTKPSVTQKPPRPSEAQPTSQRPVTSDGQCRQEGFIGDPNDCSRFYRCVDNGKGGFTQYSFKCGDGTVWDNDLQTCNYDLKMCNPHAAGNTTTSWQESTTMHSTQPTTLRPTTTKPQPTTTEFPSTISSTPDMKPTSQYPETTASTGKYPSETTTTTYPSTSTIIPSKPITTTTPCSEEGFFGDSQNCQIFYRCVDNGNGGFDKHSFKCGNNTVWDATIEGCNHPSAVEDPNCHVESTTLPTMSTDNYPTTTEKYVTSPTYKPTTMKPTYYPTTGMTESTTLGLETTPSDKPTTVTDSSTTPEYTTTIQTPTTPIPNLPPGTVCKGEGFMADHQDCRKLYRCTSSGNSYIKNEFTCAKGTGWSEEKQTCDYVANIERCAGQTVMPESSTTPTGYETTPTTTWKPETTTTYPTIPTIQSTQETTWKPKPTTTTDIPSTYPTKPSQETTEATWKPKPTTIEMPSTYPTRPSTEPTESSTRPVTDYTTTMSPASTTPIPNLPPGTKCQGEGFMADPNNCRKFYRCIQNGDSYSRHEFECAKGTGWSEEKQTCDYAANIERCAGQTERPDETTTTTYESTTKPASEITTGSTWESKPTSTSAPPTYPPKPTTESSTWTPDPTTWKPNPTTTEMPSTYPTRPSTEPTESSTRPVTDYTTTMSPASTTPIPNLPPGTKCQGEGFMADPDNCRKFYRCIRNGDSYSRHEFECAKGTGWSEEKQTCDYAANIERCAGQTERPEETTTTTYESTTWEPKPTTTGTTNTYPTKPTTEGTTWKPKPTTTETSSTYPTKPTEDTSLKPKPTTTTEMTTPTSTTYPTGKPGYTPTTGYPSTTTTDEYPSTTTIEPTNYKCSKEGFFPDPDDCNRYYRCVDANKNGNLQIFSFRCPNGTVWDASLDTCNYKENVNSNCTSGATTTAASSTDSTTLPATSSVASQTEMSTTTAGPSPTTGRPIDMTTLTAKPMETTTTGKPMDTTIMTSSPPETTTTVKPIDTTTMTSRPTETTTTGKPMDTTTMTSSPPETTTTVKPIDTTTMTSRPLETTTTGKPTDTTSASTALQSTTTIPPQTSPPGNTSSPCPQTNGDQNLFVCPTGFRRHPKNCNMFYQCTLKPDSHDMSIVAFTCPHGTIYYEDKNLCDKPYQGERCLEMKLTRSEFEDDNIRRSNAIQVRSTSPLCPSEGHFALNDAQCGQAFIKCSFSQDTGRLEGQMLRCPEGFAYWYVSRRCERVQKLANCTMTKYEQAHKDLPMEWVNIGNRRRNLRI